MSPDHWTADPAADRNPDPQARAVRLRVALAGAVAGLLIVAVIVLGVLKQNAPTGPAGPLAVAANEQPYADSPACRTFMAALPARLGELDRRELAAGSPTIGAAGYGDPAVVVRCGLADPSELTCNAALTDVNGVSYLLLTVADSSTYLVVDRGVRVAISTPEGDSTATLQAISDVVSKTLQRQAVCTDGRVNPAVGK